MLLLFFLRLCLSNDISEQLQENMQYIKMEAALGDKFVLFSDGKIPKNIDVNFVAMYGVDPNVTVKTRYATPFSWDVSWDPTIPANYTNVSQTKGIFYTDQDMYLEFTANKNQMYTFRSGYTTKNRCPNGTYVTNYPNLNIGDYMNRPDFLAGQQKCLVIICQRCQFTLHNTLNADDEISYLEYWDTLKTINHGDSVEVKITLLAIKKGASLAPRNCNINLVYTEGTPPIPSDQYIIDSKDLNMIITKPEMSPQQTLANSPYQSPQQSNAMTPYQSPQQSNAMTPYQSPQQSNVMTPGQSLQSNVMTPIYSPHQSNAMTLSFTVAVSLEHSASSYPDRSPRKTVPATLDQISTHETPFATWDGEFEEIENIIIRGNDIPEIKDTHPPICTPYVKPPVPMTTKVTAISFGVIVIVVILILTAFNFIRSCKKIKENDDLFSEKSDSPADETSSEFFGLSSSDNSIEYISPKTFNKERLVSHGEIPFSP